MHWISFSVSKRQPFFSFFLFGEQCAGCLARLHTSQFRWFYQMFFLSTSGHNSKNLALTVLPCRMNFMMHNPLNVQKKNPKKRWIPTISMRLILCLQAYGVFYWRLVCKMWLWICISGHFDIEVVVRYPYWFDLW